MNRPNTNPDTGVAFGVISAQVLDSDLVDQLLFGSQITNHTYQLQRAEALLRARQTAFLAGQHFTEEDEEAAIEEFAERFTSDEDFITGEWQHVSYATSWFGGALHFIITVSPYTRDCAPCSPCIPGAGDLHNGGTVTAYDVPKTWRYE